MNKTQNKEQSPQAPAAWAWYGMVNRVQFEAPAGALNHLWQPLYGPSELTAAFQAGRNAGGMEDITRLTSEVAHWKGNHGEIVKRLALFTQRDDLPVDRLPAYQALIRAQEQIASLTHQLSNKSAWCGDVIAGESA